MPRVSSSNTNNTKKTTVMLMMRINKGFVVKLFHLLCRPDRSIISRGIAFAARCSRSSTKQYCRPKMQRDAAVDGPMASWYQRHRPGPLWCFLFGVTHSTFYLFIKRQRFSSAENDRHSTGKLRKILCFLPKMLDFLFLYIKMIMWVILLSKL